jgi:hypothetical protein
LNPTAERSPIAELLPVASVEMWDVLGLSTEADFTAPHSMADLMTAAHFTGADLMTAAHFTAAATPARVPARSAASATAASPEGSPLAGAPASAAEAISAEVTVAEATGNVCCECKTMS